MSMELRVGSDKLLYMLLSMNAYVAVLFDWCEGIPVQAKDNIRASSLC